jgi:predicted dehydrogenase
MLPISRRVLLAAAVERTVRLPRKVRLGIVGTVGHLSEITRPLPMLPDVELVAMAEADGRLAERFQKSPAGAKAKLYSDYRNMLDAEQLDVLGICTPNGGRAAVVAAGAERGLALIAEKPTALSRKELATVRKAVERGGKPMWLLLPMRYQPEYLAMKKLVADGAIGTVGQMSSQKSYRYVAQEPWKVKRETYGSTILWIGIHMFDLMRWTSGRDFTEAYSYQSQVAPAKSLGEMENTTSTILKMDNGWSATLHMDYFRPDKERIHGDDRLRLAGSEGVIEYMEATGLTLLRNDGKGTQVVKDLPAKKEIFVEFLQTVFNGQADDMPARDVWRVNEITIAAHEAAEAGRPVKI